MLGIALEKGMEITRSFEGERLMPYHDIKGRLTIGVGRNLGANGISRAEMNLMFASDYNEAIRQAQEFNWFSWLNAPRQAAVVDLIFNMGLTKFKRFERTISAISAGDWVTAKKELYASDLPLEEPNRLMVVGELVLRGEWTK